jgi:hypothetical protein
MLQISSFHCQVIGGWMPITWLNTNMKMPCQLPLLQMYSAADVWRATGCMRQLFTALTCTPSSALTADVLLSVLHQLPASVCTLPEHGLWQNLCMHVVSAAPAASNSLSAVLLHIFKDVHALITGPEQLQRLRQLSFTAIKAWADSDDLVVDSEDSVAVALGWWVAGAVGSKCSKDQLKELSGLVRVRQLTTGEIVGAASSYASLRNSNTAPCIMCLFECAGYLLPCHSCLPFLWPLLPAAFRLYKLPHLVWFDGPFQQLACLNVAMGRGVWANITPYPPGWLKAPRKQLSPAILQQRIAIKWDVPKAELQALLEGRASICCSPAVYAAGSGHQLNMSVSKKEGGRTHLGAYLRTCDYKQHDTTLCTAAMAVSCLCVIEVGHDPRNRIKHVSKPYTMAGIGCGWRSVLTAATPADLEPYLVDGCLRLEAPFRLL